LTKGQGGRTLEEMDSMRALVAGLLIVATGVAAIVLAHAAPRAQILGGILVDVGTAALLLGALLHRWQRQLDRVDDAITRTAAQGSGSPLDLDAARSAAGDTRRRAAG
jgi:hypothetical protein